MMLPSKQGLSGTEQGQGCAVVAYCSAWSGCTRQNGDVRSVQTHVTRLSSRHTCAARGLPRVVGTGAASSALRSDSAQHPCDAGKCPGSICDMPDGLTLTLQRPNERQSHSHNRQTNKSSRNSFWISSHFLVCSCLFLSFYSIFQRVSCLVLLASPIVNPEIT